MYEIAEDHKDNICETCKLPNEIMLDNWGKHLGIPREKMESDDSYRKRLAVEITKKPNTLMEDIKKSNVGNYEIIDNGDCSSLTITANEKDSQIMKDILINHIAAWCWPFCKFKVDSNHTYSKQQQKDYDVFCPHCATEHKLSDEKEIRINFEDKVAWFNCKSCKSVMGYNLKINPDLLFRVLKEKLL